MRTWWAGAAFMLVVLQAVAPAGHALEKEGIGVSLFTPKNVYISGEAISIKLTLFNYTRQEIALRFNTSQRYDFIVELAERKGEVWRWSDGRMFLQILGEERVGPEMPEKSYTIEIPSDLREGQYTVTGVLTSADRAFSASILVEVR